jgi:hypothetical protein
MRTHRVVEIEEGLHLLGELGALTDLPLVEMLILERLT